MKIVNNNIKSFVALTDIVILDANKRFFYSCGKGTHFNVPRGTFYISGSYQNAPVRIFELAKLPEPEYVNRKKKSFKLVWEKNPNKCSVSYATYTIFFDPSFKKAPKVLIDFILSHEFGHRLYKKQLYADLYAHNRMLRLGYNPSQIMFAQYCVLSKFSQGRKDLFINELKKYNQKNG